MNRAAQIDCLAQLVQANKRITDARGVQTKARSDLTRQIIERRLDTCHQIKASVLRDLASLRA